MPEILRKPKPRLYNVGDTIVITGPIGKSSHIGQRAIILDFNYLPKAYSKGYSDYTVSLELIDLPNVGDHIRLQGGYMKPVNEATPELIATKLKQHVERKEEAKQRKLAKREGIKAAHNIATPSVIAELKALKEKDFRAYEERLHQLSGYKPGKTLDDKPWITYNELRQLSWR